MAFIISLLTACATSPQGRQQMMLLPEDQMQNMGIQAFSEMKTKTPATKNPQQIRFVTCVAQAITQTVNKEYGQQSWEIVVFDDPQINAFALPGGKIGVYTGILQPAQSPEQLAAVIGHEVGHVIARHGNERVSQALIAQGGLAMLDASMKEKGPNHQILMAGLGLGVQFGYLLPHGRTQESEADVIGLELMAKAGFDPTGAVELWQNMSKAKAGKEPPQWMSTHPSNSTRIKNLKEMLPKAQKIYLSNNNRPQCT